MGENNTTQEQLTLTLQLLQQTLNRNDQTIEYLMEENKELKTELKSMREDLSLIKNTHTLSSNNMSNINKINTNNPTKPKKDRLKEEIIRKFNRKKKDFIKNKILEIITTRSLILPELKEIVVDDFAYCSKATFYRYIKDINKEGILEIQNDVLIPVLSKENESF
jgi:cell division protein FtsB